MLDDPSSVIDLLANSLPSQSTYFIQISVVGTFVGMAVELHRILPLSMAAIRRFVGPNLTEKERSKAYLSIPSLEDPWDFQHAEVLGQTVLYFMVFWVYCTIAPLTCLFLAFCYVLLSSGYRHQFIYNYPSKPDSGGKMWSSFIIFCLIGMLIAEFTLVGLLALKKASIATPFMFPLIAITILFIFYIGIKHFYVTKHLSTRECLQLDRWNHKRGGLDLDFLRDAYLQPALQRGDVLPDNLHTSSRRSSHEDIHARSSLWSSQMDERNSQMSQPGTRSSRSSPLDFDIDQVL